MTNRPYVVLSSAMSIDGYLDTAGPPRLVLSNELDLDRVDEVRSQSDAILVGARTVRLDDPRLLVRSATRRRQRALLGRSTSPWKVTMTRSGDLSPDAAFFADDAATKLVYCPAAAAAALTRRLAGLGTVIPVEGEVTVDAVVDDLADRGIARLLVEGGGTVHTQFLTAGLADELHLVVAPLFVGEVEAPRFVQAGSFSWTGDHRARLADVQKIDDVVLLTYLLSERAVAREHHSEPRAGLLVGRS